MEVSFNVASVFKDVFAFNKRFVLLRGGRDSGKTTVTSQIICTASYQFPERDIIIGRDSYVDLITSTYRKLKAFIFQNHLERDFEFKKEPIYIRNKRTKANIYFVGIGGADKDRTKSYETEHKLSVVLFEELQQVKDQENLEQAHASFRRLLDDRGVMIHNFNPPSQNSNWVNIYWTLKKQDPDWLCVNSDYRDIAKYLNDVDLKEILKMKVYDEQKYQWLYLGETGGGFGSVYPQFKRSKHLIPWLSVVEKFGNTQGQNVPVDVKLSRFSSQVMSLVIGVDGAVTHDSTSLIPCLMMSNGQICVAEIFHHDPKLSGQKSSSELLPFIKKWLKELETKYQLQYDVPIVFYCDSASTELVRLLRYQLDERYGVYSYGKQTILEMVDIVQSTLAKNIAIVMDFGGYKDYLRNSFVKGENPLVVALESLIWDEQQRGYDKSVPNDDSDAFTYAINSVFRNPDNLYAIDHFRAYGKGYYDN